MINFKELVKERDAAKLRIDEINNRIDSIRMKNDVVPHTLNQELISTEEYHKQLILRIGRSLTDEDVAVPVTVVTLSPEDFKDSEDDKASDLVEELTNRLMSGNVMLAGDITPADSPFDTTNFLKDMNKEEVEKLEQETPLHTFNPADILQAIAGVGVSEESDEVDEEQCGCKDCTSEEDDAEDIAGSIVKAFMLMGAIKALEEKKEGK